MEQIVSYKMVETIRVVTTRQSIKWVVSSHKRFQIGVRNIYKVIIYN